MRRTKKKLVQEILGLFTKQLQVKNVMDDGFHGIHRQ
jgi:hypothetical protein